MQDCVSSPHPSLHPAMGSMYQAPSGKPPGDNVSADISCVGMMSPHHLAHHPHHHPHGPPMPLSDVDTDPRELGTGLLY